MTTTKLETTSVTRSHDLLASAAGAASGASAPLDYVPMTADGLLMLLRSRLKQTDSEISALMRRQDGVSALQTALGKLQETLKKNDGAGGNGDCAFDGSETIDSMEAAVKSAIADAKTADQPDVVSSLESVIAKLHEGSDAFVSKGDLKDMCDFIDNATSTLRGSSETDLMRLKSFVDTRGQVSEMFSNMLSKYDQTLNTMTSNIGH